MSNDASYRKLIHDLRSHLNGVMGYSQLFDEKSLSADQASYVRAILEACRGMAATIDQLSAFFSAQKNTGEPPSAAVPIPPSATDLPRPTETPVSLSPADRERLLVSLSDTSALLEEFLSTNEWQRVLELVPKLKRNAARVGLSHVVQLAAELENAARSFDIVKAKALGNTFLTTLRGHAFQENV